MRIKSIIQFGVSMVSNKKNSLMRQPFKKNQDIAEVNEKLDKLNDTVEEIRDLLVNNSVPQNVNNQKVETSSTMTRQNQKQFIPEPDISSIKSSNKEREKKTVDSSDISDALDSLNEIDK